MRYWLTIALFLSTSPVFAQADVGADTNSIPESEPAHWDRDAGEPDWDALVRKETSPEDIGSYCGDGTLGYDDGRRREEECDGEDFGGATCQGLGYESGSLACTDSCEFDTSECVGAVCGDLRVDGDEECDLPETEFCYYGRESYEVCVDCVLVMCTERYCGDGVLETDMGEVCDPGLHGTAASEFSCESIGRHPTDGATCNEDCSTTCDFCGDGVVQPEFEACEGEQRRGTSPICAERGEVGFDECVNCSWESTCWVRDESGDEFHRKGLFCSATPGRSIPLLPILVAAALYLLRRKSTCVTRA